MNIDSVITTFLHNLIPHTPITEFFFSFFSLVGSFALIWIGIGLILMVMQELRHRRYILTLAGALFSTLIATYIMKIVFGRARPVDIINVSPACPADFSFPSAHASLAFAGAFTLSYFDKKRRPLYYAIAVIISYSRIFLGCHYAVDVAAGALLGFIVSYLVARFVQKRLKP